MDLGALFQSVTGLLHQQTADNPSVNTGGLIGQITSMFQQHGATTDQTQHNYDTNSQSGGILPSSSDPLGDPDDRQGGNGILPSSADPLGDPDDRRR